MSRRFVEIDEGGYIRIRAARPGYDAGDMSLDPRFLSFDSQWRNGLRLVANGRAALSNLPGGVFAPTGMGSWMNYRDISVPGSATDRAALTWLEAGGGNYPYIPDGGPGDNLVMLPYARRYLNINSILQDNVIRVQDDGAFANAVYFAFSVPTFALDPVEDSTSNGSLFGNHPTRGMGLYISRRGTDPFTCPASDFILTTERNHFQIAEIGRATAHNWQPTTSAVTRRVRVTLNGWYPHYPPILAFKSGGGNWIDSYWLSPNEILLDGYFQGMVDFEVRFAIVATDPEYQGGVDAVSTLRCLAAPHLGFGVTKHNVHADYAGEWDWIFRADRMSLHVLSNGFTPITTGKPEGINPLPVASTSGMAITFYLMAQPGIGMICGCGSVSPGMFQAATYPTAGPPRTWWEAATVDAANYSWRRDPGAGLHTGGSVAVCNVADF